jgi:16S rRNA (guanine527-N7)-methyltransferase
MVGFTADVDNLLRRYREITLSDSKKLNLVSRRDVEKTVDSLIAESILPLGWEGWRFASPLLDIGSGAGIPGIPLRIAKPDLCVILLDSNHRKSLFLKKVVMMLSLNGVEVVNERAEKVVGDVLYSGHFNTVVSRATAPLTDLVKWGMELLKPGGELIVWKGSRVVNELARLDCAGWSAPDIRVQPNGLTLVKLQKCISPTACGFLGSKGGAGSEQVNK